MYLRLLFGSLHGRIEQYMNMMDGIEKNDLAKVSQLLHESNLRQ